MQWLTQHRYLSLTMAVAGTFLACYVGTLSKIPFQREGPGYFVKIPELKRLDAKTRSHHLLVNGYIKDGSIVSTGKTSTFLLVERLATPVAPAGRGIIRAVNQLRYSAACGTALRLLG